jgi:hypothetical protein
MPCSIVHEAYSLLACTGILYAMHPSRNYLESMISWEESLFEDKIIKPDEC